MTLGIRRICSWRLIALVGFFLLSIGPRPLRAADDVQDLVFLGPTRPVLLRLSIHVDGAPFRQAWREHLDRMFAELDEDGDRHLRLDQAARLYELVGGDRSVDAENPGSALFGDLITGDGDLLDYEQIVERIQRDVPLIELRFGAAGSGPALFFLLDRDHDRRLSGEELADAAALLARRDFNGDELFTEEELLAAPLSREAEGNAPGAGNKIVLIDDTTTPDNLADALLTRYDANRDGRLAIDEPHSESVPTLGMQRLDENTDGQLDRAELAKFADRDADVTIAISLGETRRRRSAGRTTRRRSADGFRARRRIDGGYRIDLRDAEIELRRDNRDPARAAADDVRISTYDGDNNGYLDPQEAESFELLSGRFDLADANGDGLLYPAEARDFAMRYAAGTALRLSLQLRDRGQDLFSMIDSTRDGRLTPRELNASLDLLASEDLDGDGQLGAHEIPQRVELRLSRGTQPASEMIIIRRRAVGNLAGGSADAPGWFQKMDRNGDGDVSRREFLGPLEVFARRDTDGDGLLDADEAAREP